MIGGNCCFFETKDEYNKSEPSGCLDNGPEYFKKGNIFPLWEIAGKQYAMEYHTMKHMEDFDFTCYDIDNYIKFIGEKLNKGTVFELILKENKIKKFDAFNIGSFNNLNFEEYVGKPIDVVSRFKNNQNKLYQIHIVGHIREYKENYINYPFFRIFTVTLSEEKAISEKQQLKYNKNHIYLNIFDDQHYGGLRNKKHFTPRCKKAIKKTLKNKK